jgi:hypothetical protein
MIWAPSGGPSCGQILMLDRAVGVVGQSTETATTKKALIRHVLLDICGFPLFGRVGMMFMLNQLLVLRHVPPTLSALLAAICRWHRGHLARHN